MSRYLFQPSVPVKVPPNKVSNELFNSDTVNDHVLTNNKDVSIPKKKDVDISKINVNIPHKKDLDIPSKNNNQSSVHAKVSYNKVFNQLFNSDTVKYYVSTINKDVSIPPPKKDVDIPQKKMSTYLQKKIWTYLPRIIINSVRYRNSMSIYHDGCQHTMFCMMPAYHIFNIKTQCQHIMLNVNIPCLV